MRTKLKKKTVVISFRLHGRSCAYGIIIPIAWNVFIVSHFLFKPGLVVIVVQTMENYFLMCLLCNAHNNKTVRDNRNIATINYSPLFIRYFISTFYLVCDYPTCRYIQSYIMLHIRYLAQAFSNIVKCIFSNKWTSII